MSEIAIVSVVDDDESMRKVLRRLIKSFGFGVEVFSSAEEFIESSEPRKYGCLILDVRMPGMSGLELQSKLVAEGCDIPIIFVTAHCDEMIRAQALAAGAADFISKPFSRAELSETIKMAVEVKDDRED